MSLFGLTVFLISTSSSSVLSFIPSTLFNINVFSVVHYISIEKRVTYSYIVSNSSDSHQSISSFGIQYQSPGIKLISSPIHWAIFDSFHGRNIFLWMSKYGDHFSIKPNTSSTFSFSTKHLPSIQFFYAKSSFRYETKDGLEEWEIENQDKRNYFNNSKQGKTVGPSAISTESSLATIIHFLITQKHEMVNLGWITNKGIIKSLDKKLEQALQKLNQGKNKDAFNKMRAFRHKVCAQAGKHIHPNAVAILETGAEVVIDQLLPPGDKHRERELGGCKPHDKEDDEREDDD